MDPSPVLPVMKPKSLVLQRQRVARQRVELETKIHEACTIIRKNDHDRECLSHAKPSDEDLSPHGDCNVFVQRTTTTASSTSSSAPSSSASDVDDDDGDDDDEDGSTKSTSSGSSSGSIHDSVETCRTLQVARQKFVSPTTGCVYVYSGPVRVVTDPTKPGRSKLVPHGAVGEIWYTRGHYYKGGVQFGFRHGHGEFRWPARTNRDNVTTTQVYRGMWEHDHREGLGTLTIQRTESSIAETALTVVGTWKAGQMHGRVAWTKNDGFRFDGSVVQGRKHGRGTETFRNGKEYSGQYTNGRPDGYGKLKEGDRLYRGQFKDGKRHHHGVQIWPHKLYEGEWQDNEMHGRGKLVWKTGASYSGEFRNGLFHGQGSYIDCRGNKFVGQWVHGLQEGHGKEYDMLGNIFTGSFQKGRRQGYGRVMYADGGSYSGGWKNGKRWGPGMLIRGDGSVEHCGTFENDRAVLQARQRETRDDLEIRNEEGDSLLPATREVALTTDNVKGYVRGSAMSVDASSMYFL